MIGCDHKPALISPPVFSSPLFSSSPRLSSPHLFYHFISALLLQIVLLEPFFPSLEELHLCRNRISTIQNSIPTHQQQDNKEDKGKEKEKEGKNEVTSEDFVSGFEKLLSIDLEDNCIIQWADVVKLSRLPRWLIRFSNPSPSIYSIASSYPPLLFSSHL